MKTDDKKSGCLICGEDLVYVQDYVDGTAVRMKCAYCGKEVATRVLCLNNHYICDECHVKGVLGFVEEACQKSSSLHPVELAVDIYNLPSVHMHGPEHHSIVPAVLVAAYCNKLCLPKDRLVREAIERGSALPGGMCGSHGACGAAIGLGIAYSIIHQVTPYSKEDRGAANEMTAAALMKISGFGGPRCCKRDSMLAFETAVEYFSCFHDIGTARYQCRLSAENRQCIRNRCPYYIK